jgi:hypothetical protein
MKKIVTYLCSTFFFVSVFGASSLAIAGGHDGLKKGKKELQRCINLWKSGKKGQFKKNRCCQLALSPLPPKSDPFWKDKKDVNMLIAARKHCAQKARELSTCGDPFCAKYPKPMPMPPMPSPPGPYR